MPRPVPAVLRFPTPYLRLIGEQLARSGVDAAAWRARHGLDAAAAGGAWIDLPAPRFIAAVRDAVVDSGEPALGLLLGERLAVNAHGVVGHAVLHSTTLGQALDTVVRYAALRMPLLAFDAERDDAHWTLRLRETLPLGAARGPILDATLLAIHRLLGALLLGASPVDRVHLPHPLGNDRALAAALFDLEPVENADHASLRVPAARLAEPLPLADPDAFALADRQCRDELARRDHAGTLTERLRSRLAGPLIARADARVCARLLAMSPRSLDRRLAAEGTRFRAVVDAARRERAAELLAAGVRLDDVAHALGYSDAANFRRAFRRWTGATPSAWRAVSHAGT